VKEKPSAFHFSGASPSDRMPKATKDGEIHFFNSSHPVGLQKYSYILIPSKNTTHTHTHTHTHTYIYIYIYIYIYKQTDSILEFWETCFG